MHGQTVKLVKLKEQLVYLNLGDVSTISSTKIKEGKSKIIRDLQNVKYT